MKNYIMTLTYHWLIYDKMPFYKKSTNDFNDAILKDSIKCDDNITGRFDNCHF